MSKIRGRLNHSGGNRNSWGSSEVRWGIGWEHCRQFGEEWRQVFRVDQGTLTGRGQKGVCSHKWG